MEILYSSLEEEDISIIGKTLNKILNLETEGI